MIEAIDIFEEVRFITELLIAEQIFAGLFAKKKPTSRFRLLAGFFLLLFIAAVYPFITSKLSLMSIPGLLAVFSSIWYFILSCMTVLYIKKNYCLNLTDTLFMCIAGYALQHVEYILVNEVFAIGIYPQIQEHLFFYFVICAGTFALICFLANHIFKFVLNGFNGQLFENTKTNRTIFALMYILLFFTTFMCQYLFLGENSKPGKVNYFGAVNYLGAVCGLLNCLFFLIVQFSFFRITLLNQEKDVVRQLLYEREKQYRLSKENIDIINRKCHDLKHQISALKQVDSKEMDDYINEVENSIMIYDNVLQTDNEVLNTILSEKSLYCEQHQIKLSCIIDSDQIDFMSTMDIYALLGNALDNAIECVSKYPDPDRRVVSLSISAKESFLCIQTNNYYEGHITMRNGLPVTTKTRRREMHGFGVQSIRHVAEKYGGSIYINLNDHIFLLQVVIPMPPEFLRLLKEKKG